MKYASPKIIDTQTYLIYLLILQCPALILEKYAVLIVFYTTLRKYIY